MTAKLILYIMGQKGLAVLQALNEHYSNQIFKYIVFARDKSVQDDYVDKIINYCKKNSIQCYDHHEKLTEEPETYKFAIGWRWIIKDMTNLIVLHDSLLPKYRGFAPLVNALINKEDKIGVTALFATDAYDAGDIIAKQSTSIQYPIKIATAIDLVSTLYIEVGLKVVEFILSNQIPRIKQNEADATYSLWRDDKDYLIDWKQRAEDIVRFINAVGFPYAGARTYIDDKLYIIEDAIEMNDVEVINRKAHIGKVIYFKDGFPCVVSAGGIIKILTAKDFETGDTVNFKKFRMRFH